jgi:hypothetical protein
MDINLDTSTQPSVLTHLHKHSYQLSQLMMQPMWRHCPPNLQTDRQKRPDSSSGTWSAEMSKPNQVSCAHDSSVLSNRAELKRSKRIEQTDRSHPLEMLELRI